MDKTLLLKAREIVGSMPEETKKEFTTRYDALDSSKKEVAIKRLLNQSGIDTEGFMEKTIKSFPRAGVSMVRGMVEPVVRDVIARPLMASEALLTKQPIVPEMEYPFPKFLGGPIKVRPVKSLKEGVGSGIQTASVLLGPKVSPVKAGGMYMGGQAASEDESAGSIAAKTVAGAALGKGFDLATGGSLVSKETAEKLQPMLKKSAERSYKKVLGKLTPTEERVLAPKLTAKLTEKKPFVWTRTGLKRASERRAEVAGDLLGQEWEKIPSGTRVSVKPIIDCINQAKSDLKVGGVLIEQNISEYNALNQMSKDILGMSKNKKISPQVLKEYRQELDRFIAGKKKGFGLSDIDSASLRARKTMANTIRSEISKKYPNIGRLNQEFSFWNNLSTLLEETIKKQPSILKNTEAIAYNLPEGFKIGIFVRNLTNIITDNVAWNSLAGSTKARLANLLSKNVNSANRSLIQIMNSYNDYIKLNMPKRRPLPIAGSQDPFLKDLWVDLANERGTVRIGRKYIENPKTKYKNMLEYIERDRKHGIINEQEYLSQKNKLNKIIELAKKKSEQAMTGGKTRQLSQPQGEGIGNALIQEAKKYKTAEEFIRAHRQSHLMDLSNPEKHWVGRAIPMYNDEPFTDIPQIIKDKDKAGSYLSTMKYSNPTEYKSIISSGDTITVYRAVPIDQSDNIRVGDYVALDKRYAQMHLESVLEGQQKVKGKIISKTIPKKDIVWGEADFTEWAYSPKELRDEYKSLEAIWQQSKLSQPQGAGIDLPTKSEIVDIIKKHPLMMYRGKVIDAYVVGTGASGQMRPDSDFDIVLQVPPQKGMTAQQFTEYNRRKIQQYFVTNKIEGQRDDLHPQWKGRRVDVYFTYEPPTETSGFKPTKVLKLSDSKLSQPQGEGNKVAYRNTKTGELITQNAPLVSKPVIHADLLTPERIEQVEKGILEAGFITPEGKFIKGHKFQLSQPQKSESLGVASALDNDSYHDIGPGARKKIKEAVETGDTDTINEVLMKYFFRSGKPNLIKRKEASRVETK